MSARPPVLPMEQWEEALLPRIPAAQVPVAMVARRPRERAVQEYPRPWEQSMQHRAMPGSVAARESPRP